MDSNDIEIEQSYNTVAEETTNVVYITTEEQTLDCFYEKTINAHEYINDSNSTFFDAEFSNSLLNVIPDDVSFQPSTPIVNSTKELEFINNYDCKDSINPVLQENVQRNDNTDQTQRTIDYSKSLNNISNNSDVQIDKENDSINNNEPDILSSFSQIFTMPLEFLPKKKKAKFDKSGKLKSPGASTLGRWAEILNAKEKARKLKEEKAAKKKALQDEKKKLTKEKKTAC